MLKKYLLLFLIFIYCGNSEARETISSEQNIGGINNISLETSSLDEVDADLVGISLAIDAGVACYIPLGHKFEDIDETNNWVKKVEKDIIF